jgi:hypothetical protein
MSTFGLDGLALADLVTVRAAVCSKGASDKADASFRKRRLSKKEGT